MDDDVDEDDEDDEDDIDLFAPKKNVGALINTSRSKIGCDAKPPNLPGCDQPADGASASTSSKLAEPESFKVHNLDTQNICLEAPSMSATGGSPPWPFSFYNDTQSNIAHNTFVPDPAQVTTTISSVADHSVQPLPKPTTSTPNAQVHSNMPILTGSQINQFPFVSSGNGLCMPTPNMRTQMDWGPFFQGASSGVPPFHFNPTQNITNHPSFPNNIFLNGPQNRAFTQLFGMIPATGEIIPNSSQSSSH
jgi:hypothetical protein